MEQQQKDLIKTTIINDINNGDIKTVTEPTGRFYVTRDGKIKIAITTVEQTYADYKKLIIDSNYFTLPQSTTLSTFNEMPRVTIHVGKPDSGKTYDAIELAKNLGIANVFIMCRDTLTLETMLQDFILEDGKPGYVESNVIKLIGDPNNTPAIIILDEANTMMTGVMKTFQPLFDDTSKEFEFAGKTYTKNLNCKFILTMNDKDKGISLLPDAILSRARIKYYDAPSNDKLATWTNTPLSKVDNLYKIYKDLNLLNVFGTRQLKIINSLNTVDEITNQLKGIIALRDNSNSDNKFNKLDTVEYRNLLNKVI